MTSKALDPIKAKTLKGNALRKYKKTITLNPTLREVIVGTLLGDASMPLKRGKPRPQGGPKDLCFAFNSYKLLQGLILFSTYMTFFKTRSGDFVGTPPRVRLRRGVRSLSPVIINLCSLKLIVMPSALQLGPSIQPIHTKV